MDFFSQAANVTGQRLASCEFLYAIPTILLLVILQPECQPINYGHPRETTSVESVSGIDKMWRAKATKKLQKSGGIKVAKSKNREGMAPQYRRVIEIWMTF
jgi:hypothetical protein